MGNVCFGPPKESINFLRDRMGLRTFVEGGTYQGSTAKWAAEGFDRVLTIENSPEMHAVAKQHLHGLANVTLLSGDTRQHLPEIVGQYDNILYWLDAHWSGGVTYGDGDECPLLDELKIIFSAHRNHAILIDDARLFLAPPPRPHRGEDWPTLLDVTRALPDGWDCVCHDDVLAVIPPSVKGAYREFMQDQATRQASGTIVKPTIFGRLKHRLCG